MSEKQTGILGGELRKLCLAALLGLMALLAGGGYVIQLKKTIAGLQSEVAALKKATIEREKESLEISYLVGNLRECYEAGELGPDQGCRKQIDPVVALGDKAVPYLLQVIDRNDCHEVLNAARCIQEINPTLDTNQIQMLNRRKSQIGELIPKDYPAVVSDENHIDHKVKYFAAIAIGEAADQARKKNLHN